MSDAKLPLSAASIAFLVPCTAFGLRDIAEELLIGKRARAHMVFGPGRVHSESISSAFKLQATIKASYRDAARMGSSPANAAMSCSASCYTDTKLASWLQPMKRPGCKADSILLSIWPLRFAKAQSLQNPFMALNPSQKTAPPQMHCIKSGH